MLAFAPLAGAQVCVPTADDLVFDQMTFIAGLDLPGGIQNMLYVELQDALVGIAESDVEAAVAALEDFSDKVENQSGRQIDAADADLLLAAAEAIIDELTAPQCPCVTNPDPVFDLYRDVVNFNATPLGCAGYNQGVEIYLGSSTYVDALHSGNPSCGYWAGARLEITEEELAVCVDALWNVINTLGLSCA